MYVPPRSGGMGEGCRVSAFALSSASLLFPHHKDLGRISKLLRASCPTPKWDILVYFFTGEGQMWLSAGSLESSGPDSGSSLVAVTPTAIPAPL